MRSSIIHSIAFLATLALGSPTIKRFSFKNFIPILPDGFPNPTPAQVKDIQRRAHGTLPNTPLPSNLSADGITSFKLIALNEIFEVAYFYELVQNITNNVPGYKLGADRAKILEDLNVILAVEELHALGANAILQTNNVDPIKPCKFNFPVSDYKSAIGLAATFTDLVLGTLQDVNDIFAQNTENGPVRLVTSVVGNEAEQEGIFRSIQKKTTPAQPFLTTAARDFAFTAIQSFIVPGSCPNINTIPLQTFKPLNVLTPNIKPKTQYIDFSISLKGLNVDVKTLSLVLINALNKPIVSKLTNVRTNSKSKVVKFSAKFPFDDFLLHGLTIAAVTQGANSFADADAVANATIFGPGLIEVN